MSDILTNKNDNSEFSGLRNLIEVSPRFEYQVDKLPEDEKYMADGTPRFVVSGPIQKAEVLNQNKRVYPYNILKREADNYQRLINENRALGELDHPNCIRRGAKILTKDGWKNFEDISDNEIVLTVNRSSGEIEEQEITKKIDQKYNGLMYHFKNIHIDTMVTPNHRFWLINRRGGGEWATAEEIYNNRKKYSKYYIPRKFSWNNDEKYVTIPEVNASTWKKLPHNLRKIYSNPLKIEANDFCSFLGIYLSEGNKSISNSNSIRIYQNEGKKADEIRELLSRINFAKVKETKKKTFNNNIACTFIITDARIKFMVDPLGFAWEKFIPKEVKKLSGDALINLLEWYHKGDGRTREAKKGYFAKEVFSTSLKLIEDLQEITIKSGMSGNIHTSLPKTRKIEDREILAENSREMNFLHISNNNGIWLDSRNLKIDKVDYNDNVFCVSVPNETFFAMDNGKTYLSGNSSIIELKNVSHVIRKLWWDDKVLYGRIEILPTPAGNVAKGLINSGITLGISSRGVGSVKNVGGVDVVQDDFILICWDLVSEPSTPGAFLFKEGKEETYSRALIENTMRHWGEDFKDSVPTVFKGVVQNQYNKKICDKIDEVFGIYNSLKYKK